VTRNHVCPCGTEGSNPSLSAIQTPQSGRTSQAPQHRAVCEESYPASALIPAGAPVAGSDMVVNASDRLGGGGVSARYKHEIPTMGKASSSKLLKLRPVTFRYNNHPARHLAVWVGS
jgi:hypothetical protein